MKSQPEINLIFAEEFLQILRILKEKVSKTKKNIFYFSKKNLSDETINSSKFIWERTLKDKFHILIDINTILLIYLKSKMNTEEINAILDKNYSETRNKEIFKEIDDGLAEKINEINILTQEIEKDC